MGDLPQEEIEKQWEVVGLYCVFLFKKIGDGPSVPKEREHSRSRDTGGRSDRSRDRRDSGRDYSRRRHKPNFGNFKLFRDVIDKKNWD